METLEFARQELYDYLKKINIDEKKTNIKLQINQACFNLKKFKNYDSQFDDAYLINISKDFHGEICGTNSRSVLFGVYAFLQSLGVKFLKPAKDGEFIPIKIKSRDVKAIKYAQTRHRGVCIEGADSIENILDMIDWLPKIFCNSYFVQFKDGYEFFDRWYKHRNNSFLNVEYFDDKICADFIAKINDSIRLRSIIRHGVGHGWTAEYLGERGHGWDKSQQKETDNSVIAQINGKREYFNSVPLNTNLCYSRRDVRESLATNIADYAQNHPEIDLLHVWLADDFNNFCECEDCKKNSPTDWYCMILNLIDEKLTERKIKTKIVFLIYYELLYTPKFTKINNQDRFIMMFAPIGRNILDSYSKALKNKAQSQPPQYNKFVNLKSCAMFLDLLNKWQEEFKGDSFLFDYHLMSCSYHDIVGIKNAKILRKDALTLKKLKLNGLINCQLQRVFFPTGIANYAEAQTLFYGKKYHIKIYEYMRAFYGKYGNKITEFLIKITRLMPMSYLRADITRINSSVNKKANKAIVVIQKFTTKMSGASGSNIEIFKIYLEFLLRLAKLIQLKSSGAQQQLINDGAKSLLEYISKNELAVQSVFEVDSFARILKDWASFEWNY